MAECTCERCDECEGTGSVWRGFNGQYLRKHRMDDLDELETCPECGGSGITDMCDECWQDEEEAATQDWAEANGDFYHEWRQSRKD